MKKRMLITVLFVAIMATLLPNIDQVSAAAQVIYSRKGSIMRHIPLPEVQDCRVLQQRLTSGQGNYLYKTMEMDGTFTRAQETAVPAPESNAMSDAEVAGGSDDYSTTNIQVEGVDEADIVKNDGEYIYIVKGRGVRIVKAYPPSQMEEVATIRDDDTGFQAQEMYVDGDYLVIIGRVYNYQERMMPYYWSGSVSKVYIFDISNMSDIKELRSVEFEGDYFTSRRIEDRVYVVLQQYASYYPYPLMRDSVNATEGSEGYSELSAEGIMPYMKDSLSEDAEPIAGCKDVAFFPGYNQPNFLIIASIPLTSESTKVQRKVYLGATDNVYVSQDNLYITMRTYPWIETFSRMMPPIPRAIFESTLVYKFNLTEGRIEYDGAGEVPGTVLNQFSMDEYGGNFRIATTRGDLWGEGESLARNNVYVLDKDMERIGEVEDIAPGERIYSVRFLGKRAYMVTFKNTDPFFVIDLGNPAAPKVLGSLKIPGYSDYLHPYDENHILGFGKDAIPDEKNQNFAWYQGMKIALFDVTDVSNPKQKFVEIIGDRGTDSELLRNHKALLFSKEKNLLAFPITVAEINDELQNETTVEDNWLYGDQVFQGMYVYNIDLINGFKLKGTITHLDAEDILKSGYILGDYNDYISRGLYIDNYLYTISPNQVHAHTLSTLTKIKDVTLEAEPDEYYYPYGGIKPMIEPAIVE